MSGFSKIDEIEKHFDSTFDDIASYYCVIRHQGLNVYVAFLDNSSVPKYLEKFNEKNECHQMFGEWLIPCFDIDYKFRKDDEVNIEIEPVVNIIAKKLQLDPS